MFKKITAAKTEQLGFVFFLFLHLIPIIYFTPFVTLDGPAHLYNAHLVQQLFTAKTSIVNHFFHLNPFPEPNWTCNAVIAFIALFVPILIAEKLWLASIILISVFGFRKLVGVLDNSSKWLSWLYFPFIYNFTFCLGFFNFAFAFAMLAWVLYWWLQHRHDPLTLKRFFVGCSIATLLYFSHLVIFLLAGLFCGIISLSDLRTTNFKNCVQQLVQILLFSLPWLILSFVFVGTGGTTGYRGEISYLSPKELTEWICNARMFVVYNYDQEKGITQCFTFLIVAATFVGWRKRKKSNFQLPFFMMLLASLLLIYFLPDAMASGGILSVRIVQLFYLFWCIWIITLQLPEKIKMFIALFTIIFSSYLIDNHFATWKSLSDEAKNYVAAAKVIPAGSVILPLNYSQNWLHANMCGYLGALNKSVVLDNYEATSKVFPVLWKEGMFPEDVLGNYCSSNKPCIHILKFEKTFALKIDYVVALNKSQAPDDSCKKATEEQLSTLFEPLPKWTNKEIQIYKRKK